MHTHTQVNLFKKKMEEILPSGPPKAHCMEITILSTTQSWHTDHLAE